MHDPMSHRDEDTADRLEARHVSLLIILSPTQLTNRTPFSQPHIFSIGI